MGNVPKAAPKAAAPKKAGAAPSRPTADAGAQPPPQQQQPPPQQQQRASPPVVGSSSACSSASRGTANQVEKDKLVPVYPEQVVTQQDGQLGEYAQFVCKICGLVVRAPAMLSCAHMFCQRCFSQWVQETKPDVRCPTCSQAMKPQDVVYFDGKGAQSAAYGLVYRLYTKIASSRKSEGRPLSCAAYDLNNDVLVLLRSSKIVFDAGSWLRSDVCLVKTSRNRKQKKSSDAANLISLEHNIAEKCLPPGSRYMQIAGVGQ
eukprot:4016200-Amphidinium_carterae.1